MGDTLDTLRRVERALGETVLIPKGSSADSLEQVMTHGIVRVETPDGPVAVIGPVLDRLVASGHVMRRVDGTHHGPSKNEVHKWVEELAVCDFCSAPNANNIVEVPDFDMQVGRSVGGWAACDLCHALMTDNKRDELLQRALASMGGGKYSAAAVAALHKQFWEVYDERQEANATARLLNDYVDDRLPNVKAALTEREKRLELVARLTGVTMRDVKLDNAFVHRLVAWRKKFGKDFDNKRLIEELLRAEYRKPLAPGQVPHWERALEARFDALMIVTKAVPRDNVHFHFPEATDLNDPAAVRAVVTRTAQMRDLQIMRFEDDVKFLRAADTYSFNAETIEAIREATKSIPHESPLSSIEAPNSGAGWFWFSEPLPFASSPAASEKTHALLWGWVGGKNGEVTRLCFSTYVLDERGKLKGHMLPSTRWYWPLELSFHDMLALNRKDYQDAYGPGGQWEHTISHTNENETLKVVAELSLFFIAACVWFKQKILLPAAAHVERHARKRYQREHKLSEPPSVRIVALRASVREASQHETTAEGATRNYTCRWIVSGHARLQPIGPGRSQRKLIWVNAYPKGDPSKPLRIRERVYAVIR